MSKTLCVSVWSRLRIYFRDAELEFLRRFAFLLLGALINRHKEIFSRNPLFVGMRLPEAKQIEPLEKRFKIAPFALDFSKVRAVWIFSTHSRLSEKQTKV